MENSLPSSAVSRRDFLRSTGMAGGSALLLGSTPQAMPAATPQASERQEAAVSTTAAAGALDLSPAQWLWYPGERTLPNTFILFRRTLSLSVPPRSARGWIFADSRYLLELNGTRVQWGPAPCDPRWPEVDPVDLTAGLKAGENVIAATVLYFGHGDGTWPMGRKGFIFRLEIEHADGRRELLVSDPGWRCHLSRAWASSAPKRWFLRALQETFDARRHPHGWNRRGFVENADWLPPTVLDCPPNKPALCARGRDTLNAIGVKREDAAGMHLRPRSIPLMREEWTPVTGLREQHRLEWRRPVDEYFEVRPTDAYRATAATFAELRGKAAWAFELDPQRGTALTFDFPEQGVGWPGFTVEAPAGTIIELMTHEAHAIGGPALLNTGHHCWSRFICREGKNRFEAFDFDSLRWLQLHFRPGQGRIVVSEIGFRRRTYPWSHAPRIATTEAPLQRLFNAAVNTLRNCAQETLVDGMGRERQQYSGDCGHQLHAIHLLCGEASQSARFLATFSQGATLDGYFMDTWPAYDRLARVSQRQLQTTSWGPLLDHGVQFVFDCWHHYLYTGALEPLREPYPRLLRFARYLRSLVREDGLLPVEDLGVPTIWLEWSGGYRQQRHKRCAFNLYVAGMMQHALAPICRAFGDANRAADAVALGRELHTTTVRTYWREQDGVFLDNLPWLAEEKADRYCDRTLAMAVLYGLCPGGRITRSIELLANPPRANMGLSYPANAHWRLWALAAGGRPDAVLAVLRQQWATMKSIAENNTISEDWNPPMDAVSQWSHAAVGPLHVAAMSLAGIRPLEPGFARYEIRPQLADLPRLALEVRTPRGAIGFKASGSIGQRTLELDLPSGLAGELVLPAAEKVTLPSMTTDEGGRLRRYRLPAGERVSILLGAS